MRKTRSGVAAAALAVLALAQAVVAADPAPTTIAVPGMHCPSCAKKVVARLSEVPGVATVRANVPAATLTVGPKAGQAPSPRALWEAVERAGYKPTKLEGAAGTFTAKPPS